MTPPALKVTITRQDDTVTIALVGEAHFDFDASDTYIKNIMVHDPRTVIVDVAGLTFVTSIGMCFLINLRRRLRETGGTMHLKALQPQVRKVLEHAHVIHLFDLPAEEARGPG